jgi:hypothetical protein
MTTFMFNLQDYETVETRLAKFIADYPDFRIDTELESFANDRFIVKAYIYRTYADGVAFSTGLAEEKITDRGVNSTSALENCETSAIGRALANAGYAAKGKRPSREEMGKVNRVSTTPVKESPKSAPVSSGSITQAEIITDESDPWYTGVLGNKTQEPKEMSAQELLAQSLGAKPVGEICSHGNMRLLEGTSKAGKPYHGFVCPAPKDQQCSPIWYRVAPDGKWMRPVLGDE